MRVTPRRDVPAGLLAATPARQAFLLLRTVFTLAPILFGLDKFANVLTDWRRSACGGPLPPGVLPPAVGAR